MKAAAPLEQRLRAAVKHFWSTRDSQARRQGTSSGTKDTGARSAVTGGAQMDGFVNLVRHLLTENGVPEADVHDKNCLELPGWYRPEKKWDLLVVSGKQLIAAVEFKSHVGPSFGNNYNNRTEEALGSATDIWAAYREGAFQPAARPWLGYLMLVEETEGSLRPVGARQPHFPVFPEFQNASYAKRYEILLTKLVRERLYDSACLLLTNAQDGPTGASRQPSPELGLDNFVNSLLAKASAALRTRAGNPPR